MSDLGGGPESTATAHATGRDVPQADSHCLPLPLLPQSQVSVCLYWRRWLQTYTHRLYLLYFLKVRSVSVCTGGDGYKHTHITYIFSTSSKSVQCLSVLEEWFTNIHTSPISSLLPQSQVSVCLYWRRWLQTYTHHLYLLYFLKVRSVSVCTGGEGYKHIRIAYIFSTSSKSGQCLFVLEEMVTNIHTSPIFSLLPQSQVSVCLYWRRWLQIYTHRLYLLYFLKVRSVSVCTGGDGYKHTHIAYIFSTSSKSSQCLSVLEEMVTNIHTSPISSLLPQSQVSVCLYWRRWLQTYTHRLYFLYFLKVKSVSVCTGGDGYKYTHIAYIFSTSSKSGQCLSVLEEMVTNIHTSPISSLLPQSQVSVGLYWRRWLQTYTHHLYLLCFLKVRSVSVCTGGDGYKHTHITYIFSASSKSGQCLSELEEMVTNIHTSPISSLLEEMVPQSQVSVCLYWRRWLQTYTHHQYLLCFLKVRSVSVCTGGDGYKHTHIANMFLTCCFCSVVKYRRMRRCWRTKTSARTWRTAT